DGPSDPRMWIAAAYGLSSLAQVRSMHGEHEAMRALGTEARADLAHAGDLAALDERWQDRVVQVYGNIGNLAIAAGDYAGTRKLFGALGALLRQLLAKPP